MRYQIYRGNEMIADVVLNGRLVLNALGENLINTTFSMPESVLFQKGDSLAIDKFGMFFLESITVNKNSSNNFDYSAVFESENFQTNETAFLGLDANNNLTRSSFSIDANAETLIDLCVQNMNRSHPTMTWYKGNVLPTDISHFDIDDETVYSFLARLASHYETSFNIFGRVVYFGVFESPILNLLEYGRFKGLTKITKRINEDSKLVNVLYASGSNENIPSWYPHERLTIDPPIVNNASIAKYGRIEGFFRDESIKPEGVFKVMSVTNPTAFTSNITFDVNSYLLTPQTQPTINFTSGLLAGYSFKFAFENATKKVSIIGANTGQGVFVPNSELTPRVGDTFNISDITQPTEYVTSALNRLRVAANKYLSDLLLTNVKLEVHLDPLYTIPGEDIKIYSSLDIKDESLNINGKYIVSGFDMDLQSLDVKYLRISSKPRTFNRKLSAGLSGIETVIAHNDIPELLEVTSFIEVNASGHNIVKHLELIGSGEIFAGSKVNVPILGDTTKFSLNSAGKMNAADPHIYSADPVTKNYIVLSEGKLTKYDDKGTVISQF